MIGPTTSFIETGPLRFRTLTWGQGSETVLFLHGLSGVAEVWGPTVDHLPATRRYVAIDQRGHGQSAAPAAGYTASDMVSDAASVIEQLGERVHLAGHSMGARIALVLAARLPHLLRSVAIIDIGPEASKANIENTVRGIGTRPERFESRDAALEFAFRKRQPTPADEVVFLARLSPHSDGSFTWRASREALAACVTEQRSRSYWREWRHIQGPALYVHGGTSNEVPFRIAEKMRRENPAVRFERFEGVGHNIPLLAPKLLAESLLRHWTTPEQSVQK